MKQISRRTVRRSRAFLDPSNPEQNRNPIKTQQKRTKNPAGTRSEFDQFAAGGRSGASLAARGLGFCFWADIHLAEPFAGEDGRVIEAEIRLTNSAILPESETPGQEASVDEAGAFSSALKEAGHDGLIVEHEFSGPEIVIFDPHCIRITSSIRTVSASQARS